MLSLLYQSTECNRRTWLHMPSGTYGLALAMSLTKKLKYWNIAEETRAMLAWYRINTTNHMIISGIEPSSVILKFIQTKFS